MEGESKGTVVDSSDEELEELSELDLEEVMGYPFNPLTGQCLPAAEASGMDIDYFAECSKESFPNPIKDEEGDICLYDVEQELVATYTDGVVEPCDVV